MGRRLTDRASIASVVWAVLGSLDTNFGSFLKDPWMVLVDVFLEVSNSNMTVYDFRTSHMNFTQNKHVKLDETCLHTHGHFKATLSNIMDVFGRLTSKFHKT